MKNSDFETKAKFVCLRLTPCLQSATGGHVSKAVYEACDEEETVVVEFSDGLLQRVDVSGRGLLGISRDVLEAVS